MFTKENILTTATMNEYENGEFKFLSVGGQEIGRMKVAEYRKLKKQPFKEPLTLTIQLFNYAWACLNTLTKILFIVPVCYFWILVAVTIYGGVDLKALTVADLFSPVILQVSFTVVIIAFVFQSFVLRRMPGYIDVFERRFRRLLDKEIPGLKYHDKFKMEWAASQ